MHPAIALASACRHDPFDRRLVTRITLPTSRRRSAPPSAAQPVLRPALSRAPAHPAAFSRAPAVADAASAATGSKPARG